MNHHTLKGQWHELTGKARQEWGRLTDDDWLQIEGRLERLAGKIQERYGIAREEAQQQVRRFTQGLERRRDPGRVTPRERAAAGL